MRKQLICAAVLVSVIGSSPPVYAWGWDDIIRPGSHVIDLKRLADSVRETIQTVEALRNEVKKLQNQIQAMRKIVLYPSEMEASIKNALQFPDMKTIFDFRDTYKPLEDFYHETIIKNSAEFLVYQGFLRLFISHDPRLTPFLPQDHSRCCQ